jgi:hypothetical protein
MFKASSQHLKLTLSGNPRKSSSGIFGSNAPSLNVPLSQTGNITAVEQLVFFPNSLRSHDVVYRFAQNGGDALVFAKIINYFRVASKGYSITANAIRKLIQNTIRERGYDHWTFRKHEAGDFRKYNEVWDKNSLTWTGCKVHCEDFPTDKKRGPLLANIKFCELAKDIKAFPSHDNALDLTYCVKIAVANPQHHLMFPRDFDFLTELLDGPNTVRASHRDGEISFRWELSPREHMPSSQQVQSATDLKNHLLTEAQEHAVVAYLMQFAVDGRSHHAAGSGDLGYIINEFNGADVWNILPNLPQNNTLAVSYPVTGSPLGVVDQFMVSHTDSYVDPHTAYNANYNICEDGNTAHDSTDVSRSPFGSFQDPISSAVSRPNGVLESPPSDDFGFSTHNAGPSPCAQVAMPRNPLEDQYLYDPRAMFWDPLSFKHMSGALLDSEDVLEGNYANLQDYDVSREDY